MGFDHLTRREFGRGFGLGLAGAAAGIASILPARADDQLHFPHLALGGEHYRSLVLILQNGGVEARELGVRFRTSVGAAWESDAPTAPRPGELLPAGATRVYTLPGGPILEALSATVSGATSGAVLYNLTQPAVAGELSTSALPSPPASRVRFPFRWERGRINTGFAAQKTTRAGRLRFTLFLDGDQFTGGRYTVHEAPEDWYLEPGQRHARFIDEIFSGMFSGSFNYPSAVATGSVLVEGEAASLCLVQDLRNYTLRAVPVIVGSETRPALIFPQFITGGGLTLEALIFNTADRPESGVITFHRTPDGRPVAVPVEGLGAIAELPYTLRDYGVLHLRSLDAPDLIGGYAVARADDGPTRLRGVLHYQQRLEGLSGTVAVSILDTPVNREITIPILNQPGRTRTAYAIHNPADTGTQYTVVVRTEQGGEYPARHDVGPRGHLAVFADETGVPADCTGTATITGRGAAVALVQRIEAEPGKTPNPTLIAIPARVTTPAEITVVPGDLGTGQSIEYETGVAASVLVNGEPVNGVFRAVPGDVIRLDVSHGHYWTDLLDVREGGVDGPGLGLRDTRDEPGSPVLIRIPGEWDGREVRLWTGGINREKIKAGHIRAPWGNVPLDKERAYQMLTRSRSAGPNSTRPDRVAWRFLNPENITTYFVDESALGNGPAILARWREVLDYFNERAGGKIVLAPTEATWQYPGITNAMVLGADDTHPANAYVSADNATATIGISLAYMNHAETANYTVFLSELLEGMGFIEDAKPIDPRTGVPADLNLDYVLFSQDSAASINQLRNVFTTWGSYMLDVAFNLRRNTHLNYNPEHPD